MLRQKRRPTLRARGGPLALTPGPQALAGLGQGSRASAEILPLVPGP